ncbi:hypothetical protein A6U98_07625 [Rhizobium sp. WYCCWR10014]|nr:hypothetical protein A6U98_07625 [Rhizobium sp. WYCCWR10014]
MSDVSCTRPQPRSAHWAIAHSMKCAPRPEPRRSLATRTLSIWPRHARPRKAGNKTQLQTADDPIGRIGCDGQKLIGVRLDRGKGREVTRVDGIRNDLPAAAKIVIGQKPDDGRKIGLAGEPQSIHA